MLIKQAIINAIIDFNQLISLAPYVLRTTSRFYIAEVERDATPNRRGISEYTSKPVVKRMLLR